MRTPILDGGFTSISDQNGYFKMKTWSIEKKKIDVE
jgi:hypothetical protein